MAKIKGNVLFTLFLVFVFVGSVVCIHPCTGEINGYTSYNINSDGTITPASAPIHQTGNTYSLIGDIRGSLTVQKSNIVLDGNGHSIVGGSDEGGNGGIKISPPVYPANGLDPVPGISYTSNVTIKNFIITGSSMGVYLSSCSNITVENNTISDTGNGILSLDQFTAGIYIEGGGQNTIKGNILNKNYYGIRLFLTKNNTLLENTVKNSSNPIVLATAGIALFESTSYNKIYHNNFINNSEQVYSIGSNNIWDDGYPSGGNYWSDYQTKYPNAKMIDDSGIGNESYVIVALIKDHYPLMSPFNYSSYQYRTTKPTIELLLPDNQTFTSSNLTFDFSTDKPLSWISYSLDGQQNVTVAGNFTVANVTSGTHSIAFYANDTFGNMATQTVNFTVNQPISTPVNQISAQTIIITATVLVTLIAIGFALFYRRHQKTIVS